MRELSRVIYKFWILIGVIDTCVYPFVRTVQLRCAHFNVFYSKAKKETYIVEMGGCVGKKSYGSIWTLLKLGDGYGFLNTILFTFYIFDIFQNKKFKNMYQWNIYHQNTSQKLSLYAEDIYENPWRSPVSVFHLENLKWSSLFSPAPSPPLPACLPPNGPSEWMWYACLNYLQLPN